MHTLRQLLPPPLLITTAQLGQAEQTNPWPGPAEDLHPGPADSRRPCACCACCAPWPTPLRRLPPDAVHCTLYSVPAGASSADAVRPGLADGAGAGCGGRRHARCEWRAGGDGGRRACRHAAMQEQGRRQMPGCQSVAPTDMACSATLQFMPGTAAAAPPPHPCNECCRCTLLPLPAGACRGWLQRAAPHAAPERGGAPHHRLPGRPADEAGVQLQPVGGMAWHGVACACMPTGPTTAGSPAAAARCLFC